MKRVLFLLHVIEINYGNKKKDEGSVGRRHQWPSLMHTSKKTGPARKRIKRLVFVSNSRRGIGPMAMKEKRDGTCITDDHRRVTDTNNYISSSMGWSRDGKKDRHLSDRIELSVRVCACVCCSTRRTTAPPVAPVIYCRSFARP